MLNSTELQMLRNVDGGAILPGIDTQVGNPLSSSQLTNVTALSQSGVLYDPAHNRVVVTKNGTVLNGVNFGSLTVEIRANNVTIQDCTFAAPTGYRSVQVDAGYYGTTVTHDTFDSGLVPSRAAAWIASVGQIAVTGNKFIDTPGDAVDLSSGTVSGNYFSGVGNTSAGIHADAVWVTDSQGPVTISNNFIDWTADGSQSLVNNAVRITAEMGSVSNVTVNGNFLVGGSYTVDAGNAGSKGTFSNISITNNYLGFGVYGAFFPGAQSGVTASGNTIFDFTNPIYAAAGWAAYQAAGIPTASLVTSTGGNIGSSSSTGSVTLYGGGYSVVMIGGHGENNFVGGTGVQTMLGGVGANIFTYLSPSDSTVNVPDMVGYFDSAKDVIDLSHIDASLAAAGVQNFTFIGTAPFSGGGAQVRYVQDPAHNITYVEADLAGNSTPDLYIRVSGLQTLTAANFALTAAQSNADMANGAALSVSSEAPVGTEIPTASLVTSTGGNIGSPSSTGSVTLYGGGYSVVMIGGLGENNFVGGTGAQTMLGGVGANIFTYLSPSDSTVNTRDMVGYFDSAKDVIDLSHIDASLAAAGVQNFTFIGTAPFSGGGAQVRYVQDPAHNITYVEADLAGNSTPDLFIRVAGLQTLTAANFALTAAQSNADMANGAALSVSLKARVGNVFDYSYKNVAGEPYSSYDAIVTNGSQADNLYLSSTSNDLVLKGSNLTITRGSGAESITVGTSVLSLAYHANETIDASASGAQTFAFGANYGNETINGFASSEANADTIKLALSSFSYLSSGMTQAQDLAAVLTNATTSGSGTTIHDSKGDSLTLAGFTPTMITAAASQFHFV